MTFPSAPSTGGKAVASVSMPGGGSRVNIIFCLVMVAGCVTAADLLLKRGAVDAHGAGDSGGMNPLSNLVSTYTIVGILFHLAGLGAWLYTLRRIPLSIAYCFTAVQQATIALGAWLWLGESISPMRWGGISLVLVGVLVMVPAIVAADAAGKQGGQAG